ncbi:MAG: hypothetical protein HY430_03105 [Candidatus Levybacteria bacterium]|nr:hypothetical protein [Candidatus Levybacteria bacterium]
MEKVRKALHHVQTLPDKKRYVEFFTAILSVPVLITVIILNVASLRSEKAEKKEPDQKQVIVTIPSVGTKEDTNNDREPTPKEPSPTGEQCKKEIGPISISYPEESTRVSDNPVQISISYEKDGTYCAAVWSYRINAGRWSDYDDKSIALYNLPKGDINFELRVKSIVTGEEKVLSRSFTYDGDGSEPKATDTPTVTPATPQ